MKELFEDLIISAMDKNPLITNTTEDNFNEDPQQQNSLSTEKENGLEPIANVTDSLNPTENKKKPITVKNNILGFFSKKRELIDPKTPSYSLKSFARFTTLFYIYSIPLILNFIGPSVLIITTYKILSWYDDSTITAAFGLSITFYLFFFIIMGVPNNEIIGIQCSKCKGSKNFKKMRVIFLRAILVHYTIFVLSVIGFYFSDKILIGLSFLPDISYQTRKIVL